MKKILAYSAICLTFLSCEKDNDSPQAAISDEPKTGSKWSYKLTTYNEAGAATGTATVNYIGTEITSGGSKWIALTDQASGVPILALQKRADGWWYLPLPGASVSLWFKTPAAVNETYPYVYGTCKVLDINRSVTVPAGTYNGCYFIQGDDTNSKEDEFWFTTNGPVLVRFDTYDQKVAGPESNVFRKQSLELVSYTS